MPTRPTLGRVFTRRPPPADQKLFPIAPTTDRSPLAHGHCCTNAFRWPASTILHAGLPLAATDTGKRATTSRLLVRSVRPPTAPRTVPTRGGVPRSLRQTRATARGHLVCLHHRLHTLAVPRRPPLPPARAARASPASVTTCTNRCPPPLRRPRLLPRRYILPCHHLLPPMKTRRPASSATACRHLARSTWGGLDLDGAAPMSPPSPPPGVAATTASLRR